MIKIKSKSLLTSLSKREELISLLSKRRAGEGFAFEFLA
jgi:hypothetical protein